MNQPKTNGVALTSTILGGLALIFGPLTSIPAIICGHIGLSKIKKSGGAESGAPLAIIGIVLGYVFTLSWVVVIAACVIIFAAAREGVMAAQSNVVVARDAMELRVALTNYYTEYRRFPDLNAGAEGDTETLSDATLIQILTGSDAARNPRQIQFFHARSENLDPSGGLLDPWGNPYRVVLDTDYDNRITVGGEQKSATVDVGSDGPDGIGGTADDLPSS